MNFSLFLKFLIAFVLIYLAIIIYVYIKQRSLLYLPNIDNYDDEVLSVPVEKVYIKNSNGDDLRSVFYESPKKTKNTLLMLHGNAGPIENRFYKINKLLKYDRQSHTYLPIQIDLHERNNYDRES